ncbi:hypothetical protein BDV95DRAFT_645526 [Massariosphaeria phaeospora]|uniref:Uncharacterized protein n=1 Tax=Massariosphaeria phaeospora TaxID=100035 RepID=A0A7C8I4T8_9PLEO|nr:hypothetical protein BDV95DRAFT_645526 [Massariosphaeria phaeospora]
MAGTGNPSGCNRLHQASSNRMSYLTAFLCILTTTDIFRSTLTFVIDILTTYQYSTIVTNMSDHATRESDHETLESDHQTLKSDHETIDETIESVRAELRAVRRERRASEVQQRTIVRQRIDRVAKVLLALEDEYRTLSRSLFAAFHRDLSISERPFLRPCRDLEVTITRALTKLGDVAQQHRDRIDQARHEISTTHNLVHNFRHKLHTLMAFIEEGEDLADNYHGVTSVRNDALWRWLKTLPETHVVLRTRTKWFIMMDALNRDDDYFTNTFTAPGIAPHSPGDYSEDGAEQQREVVEGQWLWTGAPPMTGMRGTTMTGATIVQNGLGHWMELL